MTLLIDLSDTLEQKLHVEAEKSQRTPEQVVVDILARAFEDDFVFPVSEIVARIKATPPNPAMITPPQGSLADALRSAPTDPNFDLDTWEQEWRVAEDELKQINLLDAIKVGRF